MNSDEILQQYYPWLRKVAGNLIGFSSPDIQDLVQEGYIAMWRALRDHDPERSPLDYWLKFKAERRMLSIANGKLHYTAHDSIPGKRSAYDIPADTTSVLNAVASPDLLESIDLAYHHGEIAAAVSRLTPQQRRYVTARFWLGLSGKEMVELGVFAYEPSALWTSKLNGARQKLRQDLAHLDPRVRALTGIRPADAVLQLTT